MANQHKHKGRYIRGVTDDEWADFAAVAKAKGSDRSAEVAAFIRWMLDRPDATPPKRPE